MKDTTDRIWWDSDVRGKPPAAYRLSMQGWQDAWEGREPASTHPRYRIGFEAGEEALALSHRLRSGGAGHANVINKGRGLEVLGWREVPQHRHLRA